MEQVLDRLILEMKEIKNLSVADGGLADFLDIQEVVMDDPGIVSVNQYPYIFVAPITDEEVLETAGRPGYDRRRLTLLIAVVTNVSDYFNEDVNEVPGTRELIRSGSQIRRHLRRLFKRLRDEEGVNRLNIPSINYVPDVRGEAFVRMAAITVVVDKQYPHED